MKRIMVLFLGLVLILGFSVSLGHQTNALAKNGDNDVRLKVFVHEPNPHGKSVIVSSCKPTINDQVADYGVAGWHMPTVGMTYKINYSTKPSNLTTSQVQTAIANSFATWTTADSKQIFNYGASTSAQNARYDGTNVILWKPINNSAIAITYVWYYTASGQLAESDTIFNKSYRWSATNYTGTNDCGGVNGTFDVQNIGTHEFGHWVGLDDLYSITDKDLTMYGYGDTTELKKDTLGTGDVSGVLAIAP